MRRALVAIILAACNVPAVDYLPTDAGLPMTTFRNGLDGYTGTQDTFIDAAQPMTGFGDAINLRWSEENSAHTLLQFNGIMDRIPANATIRDALLELYILDAGSPSGMLFEITGTWTEATTYNTFGPTPGVQRPEDRGSALVGFINGATAGANTFHVGTSIQKWRANPALNKGWVFVPNDIETVDVASSEHPVEIQRPSLTIMYSL